MSMAVDTIARAMAASAMSGGGGSYGMPIIAVDGTAVDATIPANHACYCIEQPTSVAVTLEVTEKELESPRSIEWRLAFTANSGFSLTVTPPESYEVYFDSHATGGYFYEYRFILCPQSKIMGVRQSVNVFAE